jgi:hypothetical protein
VPDCAHERRLRCPREIAWRRGCPPTPDGACGQRPCANKAWQRPIGRYASQADASERPISDLTAGTADGPRRHSSYGCTAPTSSISSGGWPTRRRNETPTSMTQSRNCRACASTKTSGSSSCFATVPGRQWRTAPDRRRAAWRHTVQVLSWNAPARHAVRAESSTSSGWNALTPGIKSSSRKPYRAPMANRQA